MKETKRESVCERARERESARERERERERETPGGRPGVRRSWRAVPRSKPVLLSGVRPPLRQPRGKSMVSLVNFYPNAARIGWHLWEIDLRFAHGLPPGWVYVSIRCQRAIPYCRAALQNESYKKQPWKK